METNEILKELRQQKHLTQQELAKILDINLSSYQKYERPNNTIKPSIESLIKIADFYGVSTDYLLGREPAPPPVDVMKVLKIEKSVDDDEFMKLYNELPDYAKQIFVDTMAQLAQATKNNLKKQSVRTTQSVESQQLSEQPIIQSNPPIQQQSVQSPVIQSSSQSQIPSQKSDIQILKSSEVAAARSQNGEYKPLPTDEQMESFEEVKHGMI